MQADLTYIRTGPFGSHEFQTGLYAQYLSSADEIRYPNGGFALEELVLRNAANPAAGTQAFHRRVFEREQLQRRRPSARPAFYVQDAWKPSSNVTISLGVRFDHVEATEKLFDIQLQKAWHVGPGSGDVGRHAGWPQRRARERRPCARDPDAAQPRGGGDGEFDVH
jgi:outer membrane receptor protein involved in Fe transport